MRAIIVLFVSACLANLCLAQETTTKRCIMYKCDSNLYKPVCGKQFKNGCWEERIFQNNCYMLSANGCSDDNYIPCVENKCEKPATPITPN